MNNIPPLKHYVRTNWLHDPLACGSYSFVKAGTAEEHLCEALKAPFGRLFFAGEATSATAPATTQGAINSGIEAAKAVRDAAQGPHKVVVIGAGLSGLTCALELHRAGRKVTVLEGADTIGGRTRSSTIAGIPATLGAAWIHGADAQGNTAKELADQLGLEQLPFDYDALGASREQLSAINALASQEEEVLSSVLLPDDSVSHAFNLTSDPQRAWAAHVQYTQEFAADPAELSIMSLRGGLRAEGRDVLLRDGYMPIVDALANGLDIKTGHVVKHVYQQDDGVIIMMQNGHQITADYCVVTLPLGVLKQNRVKFTPAFPIEKQHAINAMGNGLMDKLWLEFDEPFWDSDKTSFVWQDSQLPGLWSFWVNGLNLFGKPVLIGFNAGNTARLVAQWRDEEVLSSAMRAVCSIRDLSSPPAVANVS